jgi:beta-ureidopropionase / N-carbamoyl-L-amino-acid hydrolase
MDALSGVEIDAVGNVIGRYASAAKSAKTLIVGSHYDTVANAGRFDGRLGIVTALVVAEHLLRTEQRLPFHLEVIGFSEEEGVRFSTPYLGSSAVAGRFDETAMRRCDESGVSLAAILQDESVDFAAIQALARRPGGLRGYVEVHIEQGPVLLQRVLPVGVVTSIAGSVLPGTRARSPWSFATMPSRPRRKLFLQLSNVALRPRPLSALSASSRCHVD